MTKNSIGKMYEMYKAKVLRERIAKKAVVLPMLIRFRRMTMTLMRSRELRGMRRVGCT